MYEFQSQTSVRILYAGSAIVKLNERIGISVGHLVENDQNAINVGQRLDVVHGQVCKSYSQKNLQNRFKAKQAL